MTADIIHHGHINIISTGKKLGIVIVGLLTDKAIASYKRNPLLKYEERKKIIENIKGVGKVIPQKTLDYTENLKNLKPDYVVHGDDWKQGIQKGIRNKVIKILKEWGGKLIETKYTKGVSGRQLDLEIRKIGTTPEKRLKSLRQLLALKPIVRIMEVHNGLTGLIVENAHIEKQGEIREFDAMWISSLCDSTAKGKPDIELIDLTSRLGTINEIIEVTTKPIILDGDTGGLVEHFKYTVKTLERLGVSAIIIEDKIGPKRNSLFGTEILQKQDDPESFAQKISEGKRSQITEEFMIIARIESLILEAGINDALVRAKSYIEAGADSIMIHSKSKMPDEILEFLKQYRHTFENQVPVVVVPTSYDKITEDELHKAGANIVIYANHLIRSAYPAMLKTALTILENKRAYETNDFMMPIKEIINLIPGGN